MSDDLVHLAKKQKYSPWVYLLCDPYVWADVKDVIEVDEPITCLECLASKDR